MNKINKTGARCSYLHRTVAAVQALMSMLRHIPYDIFHIPAATSYVHEGSNAYKFNRCLAH